ncbi:MAG: hypothetical protein AAGA87_00075 [Pseudomonadota bacterium]
MDPTKRLWFAVLRIGLIDAALGRDEDWLLSDGFHAVCEACGLVPEAVAARFEVHREELGRLADARKRG